MNSVFETADELGGARSDAGFKNYWDLIRKGVKHLTETDLTHVAGCRACEEKFFEALQDGDLKVSAELMSQIKDDVLRRKVVRMVCLRAAGSSILSGS